MLPQRTTIVSPGHVVGSSGSIAIGWFDDRHGLLRPTFRQGYIPSMRFEKVWVEQCRATKAIKRRFGAKSALDYLIGEKLITFADVAKDHPPFARELPKFLAAIWRIFNEYEIAGYVISRKPKTRNRLRQLLYLR